MLSRPRLRACPTISSNRSMPKRSRTRSRKCSVMLNPTDGIGPRGIDALKSRLAAIRAQQPGVEHEMVTEVVRAVLTTISDDLTAKEPTLLRAVEELGRTIATAKS